MKTMLLLSVLFAVPALSSVSFAQIESPSLWGTLTIETPLNNLLTGDSPYEKGYEKGYDESPETKKLVTPVRNLTSNGTTCRSSVNSIASASYHATLEVIEHSNPASRMLRFTFEGGVLDCISFPVYNAQSKVSEIKSQSEIMGDMKSLGIHFETDAQFVGFH